MAGVLRLCKPNASSAKFAFLFVARAWLRAAVSELSESIHTDGAARLSNGYIVQQTAFLAPCYDDPYYGEQHPSSE